MTLWEHLQTAKFIRRFFSVVIFAMVTVISYAVGSADGIVEAGISIALAESAKHIEILYYVQDQVQAANRLWCASILN